METTDQASSGARPMQSALEALLERVAPECTLVQVRIRRLGAGFELRHESDRTRETSELQRRTVGELRALAQVTAQGHFRPIKAAPTLRSGWYAAVADAAELEEALTHLYPGAVADWHAAQADPPPVTHYREFTNRQTGMYRGTQQLNEAQAALVARSVCHRSFCLKQRLWTVGSLPADSAAEKSMVPCLEPCAVLLEFARKVRRWDQERPGATGPGWPPSMRESIRHSVEVAMELPVAAGAREADFEDPGNRRRLRWVWERLKEAEDGSSGLSSEGRTVPGRSS